MNEVVVVGAGPNGLAAAVTLARAGLAVELHERANEIGGGIRTTESTVAGYRHDVGAAVHPMALASPFFEAFQLAQRVRFVVPELSYAQPLPTGRAGLAYRDLERTAEGLGADGEAWRRIFGPLVDRISDLMATIGDSLVRVPPHPVTLLRFGLRALEQGSPLWNARFRGEQAPAMLSGLTAHSAGRMPHPVRAGAGLVLGAQAHAAGWPIPIGGSSAIADALAADLVAHGGRIVTSSEVVDLRDFGDRLVVLDLSAPDSERVAGTRLPERFRQKLRRVRHGAGLFKLDAAVSDPIPWLEPELAGASTIQLGGTRAQIAADERDPGVGDSPFVLLSQPTLFDPTRAPQGRHTVWAYTHVPHASDRDRSEAIIGSIERLAPGFRDTIIAARGTNARDLELGNPNLVGGDLSGGVLDIRQVLSRPRFSPAPWRTPDRRTYLCSSATTPGAGVHGLSGWHAARTLLRDHFPDIESPQLGIKRSDDRAA